MLAFMVERLRALPVPTIVATSDLTQDDAVADLGKSLGVPVIRGPEQDVLARFGVTLESYPAQTVLRLTADCPLVDPDLILLALDRQRSTRADYVSNTLVRTFPDGLDVEAVASTALEAAVSEARDREEREHVTPFVYRRPERFSLGTIRNDESLAHERWTIDWPEDLEVVRDIVRALDHTQFGWRDVLRVRPPQTLTGLRLVPAPDSESGQRKWIATDGSEVLAAPELSVRAGVGRLSLHLRRTRSEREEDVMHLVRRALAQDFQVRELINLRE
jgi:spore coat polysaccharide biosynthesis protein SpsF